MIDIPEEIQEIYNQIDASPEEIDVNPPAVGADPVEPSEPVETVEAAEEPKDDRPRDEHGRFVKEGETEEKPVEAAAEEKPVEEVAEEKPAEEVEGAPASLPVALKRIWGTLPEDARAAFKTSQDEMASKLGDATRVNHALQPIHNAMVEASKNIPHLMNLPPQQVAQELTQISQWAHALQTDPAGTLAKVAEQHGATQALASRLGGQQPPETANMTQEIAQLKAQIQRLTDPGALENRISQQVEQATTAASTNAEVQAFAHSKQDWASVEPYMPSFVQTARQMLPQGSNSEILSRAYDMACNSIPEVRDRLTAAKTADANVAARAQDAAKAKAINVTPNGSAGSPPMSDREAAKAIWDKHFG